MMGLRFILAGREDLRIDWKDVRKNPMKYVLRLLVVLLLIAAIAVAYEIIEPLVATRGPT
jgi:hypothetical protein